MARTSGKVAGLLALPAFRAKHNSKFPYILWGVSRLGKWCDKYTKYHVNRKCMCFIQFMVFLVVLGKLLKHILGTTHELSMLGVKERKESVILK